jgi:hypothetical protein
MPAAGEFHRYFWGRRNSTGIRPSLAASRGGYPIWQASVIAGSLFGAIGAWWEVWWTRLLWHLRIARRLHQMPSDARDVAHAVIDVLGSPAFPLAQQAVQQTAITLDFNRESAWRDYSRTLKADQGRMQNVYRHLRAMALLREAVSSTLSNPDQNLLIELAYVDYRVHPSRTVMVAPPARVAMAPR